ncbi:TetR/AcrR family transcriptional regulator [Calothrix sp. 336/3]|uniref:TetR/AcrR family transcriptional regulator n=1 Tax=Calothrix sp. 336/3 TaxID=1337936 RepID=UPI0004E41F5F|nr:TetR/AcrR family transcriptional regulator [Calothrix sp. 336/3]AKG20037.1 TetR family transcriptional regulator [Calothrix sp. 336/3]
MSKGQETKLKILQQAAELFNQQGYAGASMSDIMKVTGLQKGGIYNHFQSKEDLAIQAFDYAIAQYVQRYQGVIQGKRHAIARLQAIIDIFASFGENPPITGGCPILNTAIESDDAHPALRERTQVAMNGWRHLICRIIQKGIARGEIHPEVNPDETTTVMIATLEGGLMMSKLYGDMIHLQRAIKHLHEYVIARLSPPQP